MRVLLLGGGGFIGRHILGELRGHGFDVVAAVRRAGAIAGAFPGVTFLEMDLAKALDRSDWKDALEGVDLIVNATEILQGGTMEAIHVEMPRALYAAAFGAGVRCTILISAISAREDVKSDYARSNMRAVGICERLIGARVVNPAKVPLIGTPTCRAGADQLKPLPC